MTLKDRRSLKSPGIVIISKGFPRVEGGEADETSGDNSNAWTSQAKVDDLLFILDHAPFGIVVNKGETGDVAYLNKGMFRISGHPVFEAFDKETALKALTPDHIDMRAKMEKMQLIDEAGGGIYLDEIRCKDGSTKIIEAKAIVLPDKTKVTIWMDVTRREEAERALREVNINLEDRVEKRTAELREINNKLRREIRERKRIEKELEHSREELRLLSEHLQRAREEERASIAREVHDELGQLLSVMKIDASFLEQNAPGGHGDFKGLIGAFEKQINGAIQAVRDICTRLRPSILTHFGLSAAAEWYLEDFKKRTGIDCISHIDVNIPAEEAELSLVLFRILQETMTNILRHAEATRADIALTVEDHNILLKIRDNGRGITRDQMMKPQSFGIIGIRERVRFWGGTSSFKGIPGEGTTVVISIPLGKTDMPSRQQVLSTEGMKGEKRA